MAWVMWSSQISGAHRKKTLGQLRRRRAARLRLADPTHAPRAVLGAAAHCVVHGEAAVGMAHRTRPSPELVEAGGVHHSPRPRPQRLAGLLDRRGAGREREVAADAGDVVVEHHPGPPQRLDDLDAERPHRHVGALQGRPARPVEAVLSPAGLDHTECAIQHPAVRIDRHADAEVVRAVGRIAVEPGAVVDVAVRRGRMGDRLGGLVDRVVVQLVEHRVLKR